MSLSLQLEAPEVHVLGQDKYEDVIGKPSAYLYNRGISHKVQQSFETGIGRNGDAVALPWHDIFGRIINVKYRSMTGKQFWFTKDGQPIKNHVYGLFLIKQLGIKEVWCVESEIDALYLWSNGIPAIAFGGASMNEVQKKLILSSGIERLVIATDNDVVGQRFGAVIFEEFGGFIEVYKIVIPSGKKDVNDLSATELMFCKSGTKRVEILYKKI